MVAKFRKTFVVSVPQKCHVVLPVAPLGRLVPSCTSCVRRRSTSEVSVNRSRATVGEGTRRSTAMAAMAVTGTRMRKMELAKKVRCIDLVLVHRCIYKKMGRGGSLGK